MKEFFREISISIATIFGRLAVYFIYLMLTYGLVVLIFRLFHISKTISIFEFSLPNILATAIFFIIVIYKEINIWPTKEQVNKLKYHWIELLVSFILPVLIVLLIELVDRSSSLFFNFDGKAFYYLPFFFLFATFEEVMFRHALLGSTKTKGNLSTKIVLSSIIFSLCHIANSGYDLVAFVLIFISSVIISLMYIASGKNLLLVSLMHTFWNFCSGNIIGGEVSGLPVQHTLVKLVRTEGNIVNGGDFGIEGSIISLIILTLILFRYTTFNSWLKEHVKLLTKKHNSETVG